MEYLITPFLAWLVAGSLKFIINSIRTKSLAIELIGYGGLPSNHSAIVTSTATYIALQEGINSPAFGVALTLSFIVLLDASSLRKAVGMHATHLNALARHTEYELNAVLRERMGHSKLEIAAGVLVGIVVGLVVSLV